MNERQRKKALKEYVRKFHKKTKKGRVFVVDSSNIDTRKIKFRKELTTEEKEERDAWAKTRSRLQKHYSETDYSALRILRKVTRKELLLVRVAPPLLTCRAISERSTFTTDRKRCYPVKLYAWKGFKSEVRSFTVPEMEQEKIVDGDVLYVSLALEKNIVNGSDEATYLVDHVLVRLQMAGFLTQGRRTEAVDLLNLGAESLETESPEAQSLPQTPPVQGNADQGSLPGLGNALNLEAESLEAESPEAESPEAESPEAESPEAESPEAESPEAEFPQTPPAPGIAGQESLPVLGNADRFLIAGHSSVPIEFKPTQNLLLPLEAAEVVRRYNKAVKEVKATKKRTIDWVNIGHPVAQLVNYMIDAKSCCGVLSSGTRSYFFKVEKGTDNYPKVFISDAWFIGQKRSLRAWAYLNHLATGNGDFDYPKDLKEKWIASTPGRKQKNPKGRVGAGGSTNQGPSNDGPNDGPSNAGPSNEGPSNARPSNEGPAKRRKRDGQDRGGPSKHRKREGQDCGAGGPTTEPKMARLDSNVAPSIYSADDRRDERPSTGRKRDGQDCGAGGPPTGQMMTWLDSSVFTSIPRVARKEITIFGVLGSGNHLVHLALWKGRKVAVKVFDVYKDFEWFEKEIRPTSI